MKYIITITFLLFIIGFNKLNAQTPAHIFKDYKLVWNDEFNGNEMDSLKWQHRSLGKRFHGIVSKSSSYLDNKGHLVIEISKKDTIYYIGQVATQNTYLTTYGYFECRAQMNKERGPHVAFWLQSPTIKDTLDNPQKYGTEIDIFEYHTNEGTNKVYHNLHWNGYGKQHKHVGTKVQIDSIDKGFHTFGLEWNEKEYIFYVDGKETWRTTEAVSQIPEYMILSAELSGWGGDYSKSNFPDKVIFDYVRVYKKKKGK